MEKGKTMLEGTGTRLYATNVYIAENISTEKMMEALNRMRETAHADHAANVAAEQARYEQQLKDIEHFRDMFYCSNYEK